MQANIMAEIIGADFYTGVPDSQLKAFCDYLLDTYGVVPQHHIIAANEGNCAAIAAGYHLATGKVPVVYMQNSGEGNIVNPCASLLNKRVYAVPILFVIGWRGEPGLHDEPQHIFQGEITLKMLETLEIEYFIVDKSTSEDDLRQTMQRFHQLFVQGRCAALVVRKDALSYAKKVQYQNDYALKREEIIQHIIAVSGEDPIISTTGKASRELFELRENQRQSHKYDFLTVGSMGHSSSIALGVALNKPERKIWCIDGDGALLMHMGAMVVIGAVQPTNLVHIVINNNAHETVGGMPTAVKSVDLVQIALACGYARAVCVDNFVDLDKELHKARESRKLSFIEVKCAIGARVDLGRPTTTALVNKENFMDYLRNVYF